MPGASENSVLVAVSGGVDSSVAALLLKRQGFDVMAVNLKLYCYSETLSPKSCCTLESTQVAQEAMAAVGAEFQVIYLQDLFKSRVIEPFFQAYREGRTPNPCVSCNATFRFPALLRIADELGCRYVATGHYARTLCENGHWFLAKGRDPNKDQSYFLWMTPNALLERIRFPLGELHKPEVRALAEEAGLPTSRRPESQEVCFLPPEGYRGVLEQEGVAGQPGPIVDLKGARLGEHEGIAHFTVGQRKGIGIAAPEPLYVVRIEPETRRVVVGPREALYHRRVRIENCVWHGGVAERGGFEAEGAVRYRSAPQPCAVEFEEGSPDSKTDRAVVTFENPQLAPTPGQSLVVYCGDRIVGGGIISRAPEEIGVLK